MSNEGDDQDRLNNIAEAVADGRSVDWDSAETPGSSLHDRRVLSGLKNIEHLLDLRRHGTAPAHSAAEPTVAFADPGGLSLNWGSLRILERVGEGAFGEVYRAHDPKLAREVALKLLRESGSTSDPRASAVIEEGRLLARVRHPNVVTVYGADRIDGRIGVWMEFIAGRTLEQVLRERGPFGHHEATVIGLDLCRALDAVHQAGLLHRDLKAQNVMREDGGRIVLMDFGTGQEQADPATGATLNLAGTPFYLAPELFSSGMPSVQSDIYSLGVLLYHLVTGSFPVTGRTIRELRDAHADVSGTRGVELPPDLPDPLAEVIRRALARDPEARFITAGEMCGALDRQQPAPRRRMIFSLISAAIVLAGVTELVLGGRTVSNAPGPSIRRIDTQRFVATGEPSRSGRWIGGVDWTANGNLAVLDVSTGSRHVLSSSKSETGEFAEGTAVSPDDSLVAYAWYFSGRQDRSELRTIRVDGSNQQSIYRNVEGTITPVGWAPDGTRVLIARQVSSRIDLAWVDVRDGTATSLVALTALPRKITLSPDGALAAFDAPAEHDASQRDLFVCNTSSGRLAPLLVEPATDFAPVWSPDGTGVVFSSDRGGHLGLWFQPITHDGSPGGEPRLVRSDMGHFSSIGFGSHQALFVNVVTEPVDVYTAAVDLHGGGASTPQVVATRFVGMNLYSDWSPDSRSLVFTSRRGEAEFDPKSQVLVIRDITGNDERVLAPALRDLTWPRWSPDGQSIVVKAEGSAGPGLYRVSLRDESVEPLVTHDLLLPELTFDEALFVRPRQGIFALDLRTRTERQLVARARAFSESRDGRLLAFERREGDAWIIAVTPASGGVAQPVFTAAGTSVVELAGWSPDDVQIIVTRRESWTETKHGPTYVLAVPAQGGTPRTIATLTLNDPRSFRLSPDGSRLSFEAGYPAQTMWVLEGFMK